MPTRYIFWITCSLLGLSLPLSQAAEYDFSGQISAETRFFPNSPQYSDQFDLWQPSLTFQPELEVDLAEGVHQFSLIPYLRLDAMDSNHTHWDLREAYWRYVGDDVELLFGVNKVFWGVTESRHLVDVINQTDAIEDIDEEDKLGQPMIQLSTTQDWGTVSGFVLPRFRERTFPGPDGRLRGPLVVDGDSAEFESDLEEWHPDVALRYSHYLGDWDFGVYYFYGTGREPILIPKGNGRELTPRYELIHQTGIDIQYTKDAWLWKFEGIMREGHGDIFGAVVAGFEYTFYQIFSTSADLGVLSEYLYDGRNEREAPVTTFQNDVFLGTRLTLNDTEDTALLAGTIIDVEDLTTSFTIEFERRIGNDWKIEVENRFFTNVDSGNTARAFKNDSFINVRLTRFF
ncbi:MAG: hypothetical protein AAF558_03990 [Verrucomicrobiota bacterium]